MKKIYYLKTCDTCKRILKTLPVEKFELQDIKSEPLTVKQLEEMVKRTGNYDSLFSKMAKKYKELGLKNENLSELEMRKFILEEYTFLKRPVIIIEDQIFVGSGKRNLEALKKYSNSYFN